MPSTRQTRRTLGHLASLSIACLYLYAGQAHFTSRFTPEFAGNIDAMTANSHRAFWFLNMDFGTIKKVFGAFDLLGAFLLLVPSTRRAGLCTAVIGFGSGLYWQVYNAQPIGQLAGLLGLAVFGLGMLA